VLVRRADALKDVDQDRVLGALPGLGGGTLVLVARGADQRRKLVATCTRAGAAYGFPPVDVRGAQAWAVRLAREYGGELPAPAAQELVERSGVDLGVLAGEVAKLVLFAGQRARIEPRHVRDVVAAVRGHAVEDLADRLARRDVRGATAALRGLLADGEAPLRLLGFLAANVRRSLHVAELAEQGLRPDEIATRLAIPPWLVSKIAGRGRAADLARAFVTLRRLDLELKSTRPTDAIFEAAVLELTRT
jgi:DNA polymerase-3 subunit delta